MRFGVTFPQIELGPDPGAVHAYAEAAQELGFDYLLAYDHVLGAGVANRPGWTGPYTSAHSFQEPFVLFAFMTAIAPRLEYVTGVIILPQRQTALVAKQAASLDVLSGGRLRLGIGVGWNAVEYEALGEDFADRGKRVEEQMDLMRRLWTEPVVTFAGEYHTVTEAGLNPMPAQRPIPLWIGGTAEVALRRAGRLADGWFPLGRFTAEQGAKIERLRGYAEAAGRPRDAVGIDARIDSRDLPEGEWPEEIDRWAKAGATHLSVSTMYRDYTASQHLAAIERFRRAVDEWKGL